MSDGKEISKNVGLLRCFDSSIKPIIKGDYVAIGF